MRIVGEKTAQGAIRRVAPLVDLMIKSGWTVRDGESRRGIHVVVAQPSSFTTEPGKSLWTERTIGEPGDLHDYAKIARSKMDLTLRFGRPTEQIPLQERTAGNTVYWGSVWHDDDDLKFAVAASGFQPEFDRLVCQAVEANILLALEHKVDLGRPQEGYKFEGDFLVSA